MSKPQGKRGLGSFDFFEHGDRDGVSPEALEKCEQQLLEQLEELRCCQDMWDDGSEFAQDNWKLTEALHEALYMVRFLKRCVHHSSQ